MAHVFISYAKKDTRELALRLHEMLNATPGFTAWMDETLVPGKSWARSIEREIDRADFVVVLLSPDVNRPEEDDQPRSFVLNEIDYAQQIGKTIIPLMAQRTRQPIQIAGLQYIDLTVNETAGMQRLMTRLGVLSEPPTEPTPTPAREPQPAQTPRRLPIVWIGVALLVVVIFGVLLVNGVIGGNGSNATLTGFEQLQTLEAQRTQSAVEQAAFALTITQQGVRDSNATATAIQFGVTETLAYATLFALSATPTLDTTPAPSPTDLPTGELTIEPTPTADLTLAPVTRNADWTPQSTTVGTLKMMRVPPGCFDMGENGSGGRQCFDAPFWIGETEVTNAQYAEFVDAGGYNEQRYWTDAGWAWKTENNVTAPSDYDNFTDDNQPRVGVTWYEAVAYTHWLTEQLRASGAIGHDEEVRLPTESEWEYVARGPDGLTYPWGNDWDATRANVGGTADGYGDVTAPVGSYPLGASWVGALDMSGNVWEWGLSGYAEYPYVGTDGRNDISSDISGRVLRGGSFHDGRNDAAASFRSPNDPHNVIGNCGVRLVLSAPYASLSSEAP